MKQLDSNQLSIQALPGRGIRKAVGKGGPVISGKMTMGFASYRGEYGPMEPHRHAEEIVYAVSSENAYFRFGAEKDALGGRIPFKTGELIHFDELEWHVFEYDEGGHLDIIFFYGQTDNIRPEEILGGGK